MPDHQTLQALLPPKALVLAPMAGITDPPYRLLVREKGADLAYSEMVSAEGLVRGNNGTRRLFEGYPSEGPLMGQLFGRDAAVMAEAAPRVQEMGLDGVDVNVGCPATKVIKKAGARPCYESLRAYRRSLSGYGMLFTSPSRSRSAQVGTRKTSTAWRSLRWQRIHPTM
jgi:hypothetical protein